ncbi:uncharacterized protein isoform X2 [Rhodnius prolixus]|uniref:uncharacterized protein isoform X2 n=1 Tax=Rhodnius prolixus TaxID=13249 RepID=UPI003D188899
MERSDLQKIKKSLNKLGLGRYYNLFEQKGMPFEVFEHLTEEDLKEIGIISEKNQATLLHFLRKNNSKNEFSDLPKLNIPQMIEDLNLQMLRLIINVQIIERRLREQPHKYYDSLLNPTTSSSQAILKFTDIALSELKYMEDAYLVKAIKCNARPRIMF